MSAGGVRTLALVAVVAVVLAWSLDRPPDVDEVNFLTLARGAAADPWRPHTIPINWQGTTEPAFAVLSNPPGIAWWLAPVLGLPVWAQRLWMLAWAAPTAWGAWELGRRFLGRGDLGLLALLVSPIVLLSATALLPDAPLYALTLAGMAGSLRAVERGDRAWPWALVLGSAALFRYSAIALWPLLLLWRFQVRRPLAPALVVSVPLALLAAHDLHAYGAVHLVAMGRFQSVANTPADWGHKAVAALTFLGGAAVLPVFRWRRAHALVAVLGGAVAAPWGPVAVGFGALGGAALAPSLLALARPDPDAPRPAPERAFLAAWALGGLAFLLTLRFTAARYWLPFLPGAALVLPVTAPRWRVGVGLALGLALVAEDAVHARADTALAAQVAELGVGRFTGHWGWQGTLEAAGWSALDEGERPPAGTLVALPEAAWPQAVDVRCDAVRLIADAPAGPAWLPRGYAPAAGANLHANWVAGPPPTRTVIPWWFGREPYERARVCAE